MARRVTVEIIGDSSSLERAFKRSSVSAKQFNHDISAASRGALAGSGIFRSLGRSLAFASGGFLAFGGTAAFLRKSVDAAKEAQVANAQLATQLTNSGKSFAAYRDEIDSTVSRLSALAGIEDDELKQGLTTILRTVPNVSQALRDLGTAADLARARHISLGAAATIIAKTEAGNTTLLRRQGFQVAKNATAEQALAKVRAVVAGQAAAGTTQQERFGAVLHQTEEIIGTGILPTLNKYLAAGSRWLEQMNESGKLQKDVANAAHDFEAAISAVSETIKTVDRITGSFKNTLVILAEVKLASVVIGWAKALNLFAAAERAVGESAVVSRINQYAGAVALTGTNAEVATGKVAGLRGSLAGLGLINIAPILIPIEILVAKRERNFLGGKIGGRAGSFAQGILDLATNDLAGNSVTDFKDALLGKKTVVLTPKFSVNPDIQNVSTRSLKQLFPTGLKDAIEQALKDAAGGDATTTTSTTGKGLTASQKNTFFDNAISRILLRGGLGDIDRQIAALQQADVKIAARIKVTKDITRKQNLEDELLQNQAQIHDLQGQKSADALAKREAARQAVQDALQKAADARVKRVAALTSKQFRQLGLSASGDEITPGVAGLKKRLGQLSENVKASSLNTPKLQSELARFRKVLSEGLVPRDVRAKIKEMMDEIADQLKNSGQRNATKFRHTNANVLLSGLGLDAETTRILRQRLAQVGRGGTVPGTRSTAFSGSGATFIVQAPVYLDGKKISDNTTSYQRKQSMRRSESRRGPYAGRGQH